MVRVEVANVRWAERNRFGLEFLKMTEADKNRLFGLVRELLCVKLYRGLIVTHHQRAKSTRPKLRAAARVN
jgi:hypothetical protein